MQKITPCLWFDNKAEEGYEIHGREAGTVLIVDFEIEGQKFTGLLSEGGDEKSKA